MTSPPQNDSDMMDGRPGSGAPEPSLYDDFLGLVEDGRIYAEAELGFQKTRASYAAKRSKAIVAFGALAVFLILLALLALVLGLLLGLTPHLGPFGAMGAVIGGLILAALICGLIMRSNIRKLKSAFKPAQEADQ